MRLRMNELAAESAERLRRSLRPFQLWLNHRIAERDPRVLCTLTDGRSAIDPLRAIKLWLVEAAEPAARVIARAQEFAAAIEGNKLTSNEPAPGEGGPS